MLDRTPTMVLPNGAIRYGVYNADGTLNRYEYIKPEDAPTQEGTPINKNTLAKDSTLALYGLPASAVPDDVLAKIKTDINGIKLFYEKIRDITDVSGASLSISLADIDWDVWRELRLICGLNSSVATSLYVRINNLSASNYEFALMQSSSSSVLQMTASTSLFGDNFNGYPTTRSPSIFDVSFLKMVDTIGNRFNWKVNNLCIPLGTPRSGVGGYNQAVASISTINVVPYNASTVYLKNASLWGVRK